MRVLYVDYVLYSIHGSLPINLCYCSGEGLSFIYFISSRIIAYIMHQYIISGIIQESSGSKVRDFLFGIQKPGLVQERVPYEDTPKLKHVRMSSLVILCLPAKQVNNPYFFIVTFSCDNYSILEYAL
jgi:hypothetical protein